jgi:hypothetical protein
LLSKDEARRIAASVASLPERAATAVAGPGDFAYAMLEMNYRQKDPDSKAAGAWALPTALPSSPIQLPSFRTASVGHRN